MKSQKSILFVDEDSIQVGLSLARMCDASRGWYAVGYVRKRGGPSSYCRSDLVVAKRYTIAFLSSPKKGRIIKAVPVRLPWRMPYNEWALDPESYHNRQNAVSVEWCGLKSSEAL